MSARSRPIRAIGHIAIADAAAVFRTCQRQGVALDLLNLGGGLPAQYRMPVPPLAQYVETIAAAVAQHFGGSPPRLMIEPGRYMVGDAGLLRAQVLLIARARRTRYAALGLYRRRPLQRPGRDAG